METITLTSDNLQEVATRAAAVLRAGGLVVYPTETVYGVGADATNPEAVSKLLKYKNRPAGKAISVLVADQEQASLLVDVNPTAANLYRSFLPGPLTVVSQSKGKVDRRLESELQTLGIRISSHPLAMALAQAAGFPITATSANAAGKPRPYRVEQIMAGLRDNQKDLLDMVIEAGELPPREPSTVIDTTKAVQDIVRAGSLFEEVAPAQISQSEAETIEYGRKLMEGLKYRLSDEPVVIALEGDLGAGKTQLAKGVALALGVGQPVTSPTYLLVKEYQGEARLVHMDFWRLEKVEPAELGLEEYLRPQTVLLIEWASPVLDYLRDKTSGLRVVFEVLSANERRIRVGKL